MPPTKMIPVRSVPGAALLAAALLPLAAVRSPSSFAAAAACGSCLLSLSVAGGVGAGAGVGGPAGVRGPPRRHHRRLSPRMSPGGIPTAAPSFAAFLAARGIASDALRRVGRRGAPPRGFAAGEAAAGAGGGGGDGEGDASSGGLFDDADAETPADRGVPEGRSDDGGGGAASASMVAAIGFYKSYVSPLLPPACRFVPTCSQYGVQAIQEFGPARGGLLTAWRLMRCSPFGGRGYDPPRWPPVPYNYGSY